MITLITSFEPFGEFKANSSLRTMSRIKKVYGCRIKKFVLPVTFKLAGEMLVRRLRLERPDVLICLGQSEKCECITLEKIAHNKIDAKYKDNTGKQPKNKKCCKNGKTSYKSNIDLELVKKTLPNIALDISTDAGTFVCNDVYYQALREIYENNLNTKCCFIHLPITHTKTKDINKIIKTIIKLYK